MVYLCSMIWWRCYMISHPACHSKLGHGSFGMDVLARLKLIGVTPAVLLFKTWAGAMSLSTEN